jgi:hypothetical protein
MSELKLRPPEMAKGLLWPEARSVVKFFLFNADAAMPAYEKRPLQKAAATSASGEPVFIGLASE